ncbi:hypothetical protein [Nonlabens sp.]|uniref:hypothetical protein n=1 Tax=Nonlabens sp. TaxID=1888209 RepID=UPI003263793E
MKKTAIKPFSAQLTLGLEYGYEKITINEKEVINFIQSYQDKLIENKQIYLSVSISKCKIIMSGQNEPHLKLSFINYPKFPLSVTVLKQEIENLSKQLMIKFKQNRVVIEYLDETIMFENSLTIDPRIKTTKNNLSH